MCPAWRRCARDLANGDTQAGMDRYCLASRTIDALAVDETGLPPPMVSEPWLPERPSQPWPMLRRVQRCAVRMHEMMRRLHVDPGQLARLRRGEAYGRARATCLSCGAAAKCRQWLDEPARRDGRPEFCPNLPLLEACGRDRPGPRSRSPAATAEEPVRSVPTEHPDVGERR
jgi:hypothetical protein